MFKCVAAVCITYSNSRREEVFHAKRTMCARPNKQQGRERDLEASVTKAEIKGVGYKRKLEMQVGARPKLVQESGPRRTF